MLKTITIFGSLGMLGGFLIWLAVNLISGSRERITIAPDTTYITTSSESNAGHVDYAQYINGKLSAGITQDNNAAVVLLKFVPEFGTAEFTAEYFKWLGIQPDQITRTKFVAHDTILHGLWSEREKQLKESGEWSEELAETERNKLFSLTTTPWSDSDYPALGKWIEQHDSLLDEISQASLRPRFYSPLVSNQQSGLVAALLPVTNRMREFAKGLSLRAMNRLAQNDWAGCQADLLAIRRLANHVAEGPAFIHKLIAYAVLGLARKAEWTVAKHQSISAEELENYLEKIEDLTPRIFQMEQTREFERIMVLDLVSKIAYNGVEGLEYVFANGHFRRRGSTSSASKLAADMAISMVDWNTVMREVNRMFDRVDQVIQNGNFSSQLQRSRDLEKELEARQRKLQQYSNVALTILAGRKAKGKYAADFMLGILLPGIHVHVQARNDALIQEQLIRVMIACESHRRQHQQYPSKLSEIQDLTGVDIIDPYTQQPFAYKRGQDLQIYSLGPNQQDEQGRSRHSRPAGDDVPPNFK